MSNFEDVRIGSTLYTSLQMLRQREIGTTFQNNSLISNYYKHIKRKGTLTEDNCNRADHGSIFNIEFSPSGKIMVAACEQATILVMDPSSRKLVSKIHPAHSDCVNCICFLDERTFASGSDDNTVALWDVRMLHSHVTKLVGHTNWVKNVAYNRNTAQLVTSGYDGTIRLWDVNKYSETDLKSEVIYRVENLSRMQLTPNADKLILSTFSGTITVFHNLVMNTLTRDVNRQKLAKHFSNGTGISAEDIFHVEHNCEESITDFPFSPWYISSLQVHPFGWCVLSRYTCHQLVEYTVIHDIQSIPNDQPRPGKATNVKRLSHYIEESNSAKGIIKEQHFSNDGRIIASPFGNGTRLLAFGQGCCELCDCDHDQPVTAQLHEIKYLISHRHAVCTTKFSPTHMLLASGCLGGKIVFHEPKL